jgi:Trk K+ transport system NAD-binding subunit
VDQQMPSTRLVLPGGRRRVTRIGRILQAIGRDSRALWNEFRWPIMVFVLVILGGGWLYGELLVLAGYPRVPYADLPYFIMRMMVFEPPTDPPPDELYLIAFWYILPVVALFILGRGATDFVRLFFDRSERRNAWEEAVASTYRNHVIVLGVGHVGLRVIRTLVSMGFDVVGIDHKVKTDVDNELAGLGVPLIVADGRDPQMLEKAGIRQAQAFVVCTSSDQTNLEVIMRVREMQPDIRIVARMWDETFAKQMKHFLGVAAVHSASELAAPAFAGAAVGIELTQTLHINGVDYSMIRLHVEPESFLAGSTIGQLQQANDMDIVLHGRGGMVEVQPHNDVIVNGEDTLVIFARHDRVMEIVERNRQSRFKR